MSRVGADAHIGPGGWTLDADGAVVHPESRTAVVADVHLGYEWARGDRGDCVPAHSLAETLAQLERILARQPGRIDRLVVAGDLVESPRPCRRTASDVAALTAWLEARGTTLLALRGNHDPMGGPATTATVEVGGWTIAHGDRPLQAPRTITGHLHPVLRAEGLVAPCFLVGPETIILPAFSHNAAGVGLASLRLPQTPGTSPLHCIAAAGGELLDFGPVGDLVHRLRGTLTRAARSCAVMTKH